MTVKKINNTVCDLDGCLNIATKQILFNENSRVGINLCDCCIKNLYDLMAKQAHKKGGANSEKAGKTAVL